VIVRDEQPADRAVIREIVQAAFGQAAEADLVDRLREDGDAVVSLVAVEDEAILGHVLLSRMQAPFRALGLAPVSVRPDRQRSGVGSGLVREALTRTRDEGWDAVFVLGDPAFYRRFGFDPEAAQGFGSPFAGPHLMALPLKGRLPVATGRVDYAPAFAALG
jgi:putative acetyltransferase